jgi:uncharacterized membrane protein YhhN
MCQNKTGFLVMYFTLALVMLMVESMDWVTGRYIVKPLLTIVLLAYFLSANTPTIAAQCKLIITALLFSCLGDSLLLFSGDHLMFLGGLAAFLIAHICYIAAFYCDIRLSTNTDSPNTDNMKNNINYSRLTMLGVVIFVFAYVGIFYNQIQSTLSDMRLPVIAYMTIISLMVIFAFMRRGHTSRYSFICVLFGAIMFVISDSLLAINQFIISFHILNVLIMLTYLLAQFFIVYGIVRSRN